MQAKDSKDKLNAFCTSDVHDNNIDNAVQKLTDIITDIANQCQAIRRINFRKSQKKIRKPVWHSPYIWNLRKQIINLSRDLGNNPYNRRLRHLCFSKWKEYRKLNQKSKKLYRQKLIDKLYDLKDNDPKAFWQILEKINELNKTNSNHAPHITLDELKQFFCNQNQSTIDHDKEMKYQTLIAKEPQTFNELDYKISDSEILKSINKLKNGKTPGLDGITYEMIKLGKNELLPSLNRLFNTILVSGKYPPSWSLGFIATIHKKGNKSLPENYRGLTINNCLGKVFNSILNERLLEHLNKNKIITKFQIGFKKDSRTVDHIFVFKTLLDKYLKQLHKKLYVCFVDFKNAFPSVWHNGLFHKLQKMGINGLFSKTIRNMYANSMLCCKQQGQFSDFFKSNIGLRQGDNLSPTLFNIYINDIIQIFDEKCNAPILKTEKVACLLYADDMILISTSKEGLQNCLNLLHDYCKQWELTLNAKKTKIVIFNAKGTFIKEEFKYNNENIECVKSYVYLGVAIGINGSFTAAKQELYQKGLKALYKLSKSLKNTDIKPSVAMHIYNHTVLQVILYGCEIWGMENKNQRRTQKAENFKIETSYENLLLNKIEMKFCRMITGAGKFASNLGIRSELGKFPLHIEIIKRMMRYKLHLLKATDNSLLKEALVANEEINKAGAQTWSTWIDFVSNELDMNISAVSKQSIKIMTNKLHRNYKKYWHCQIYDDSRNKPGYKNKLRTYRKYKVEFEYEAYFDILTNRSDRKLLCNFRLGVHRLRIETGRYHPYIPAEDRICYSCINQLEAVEDEPHFIMVCPKHKNLRLNLFSIAKRESISFDHLNNYNKFIWLMSSKHINIINGLCKYIKDAMANRSTE